MRKIGIIKNMNTARAIRAFYVKCVGGVLGDVKNCGWRANLKMMNNQKHTDRLLDLKGLSEYSSLGVSTLRDYLRSSGMPHFKLKGKILVRISEFDRWLETFRVDGKQRLESIVNDVMKSLQRS